MPFLGALDVCRDTAPCMGAMNMAIDEALLEHAQRPVLRFYEWDHPAISLGYFGKFAEVEHCAADRDIVRRWTGGGTVFHGDDLTYCLVIPTLTASVSNSSRAVYAAVHEALRTALEETGYSAELASKKSEPVSDACFANPVADDVILENRKIAGAAHRRTRAGLLHQGSIQNIEIRPELVAAFVRHLSSSPDEVTLAPETIDRAGQIAETKYASPAWLHRW